VNYLVKEFFITVQFRRNNGTFGGKDYVYKLISPMYLGKHDELLILKDPVNEKGHSYNTEMLVTGVFDDYEAYQKYCKLKNVFVCAYEDILFLRSFKIAFEDRLELLYENQDPFEPTYCPRISVIRNNKKMPIMAGRPENQDILIDYKKIKDLIDAREIKTTTASVTSPYDIAYFKNGSTLTTLTGNDLLNAQLQSYDADKHNMSNILKKPLTSTPVMDSETFNGLFNKVMNMSYKEVTDTFNSKEKEKESKMDFSKILNIDFGKVPHTAELKPSIYGVAVLGFDNRYRAYDKINDKVMDVTGMTFDTDMLFKIPVAVSQVRVGDVIINASNYVTVTNVHPDGTFTVVDPKASEQKIAIPAKNMFGFDFVTKIMYPFENMVQPSDDNPFGLNPMTMMMLSDGADMDMSTILALSMMNGNSSMMDQNMLIPLMLMGNGKSGNKDGLILAMAMMNQPHPTKKIKREIQSNAFAALDSCPIPLVTDEKEAPTGVNACKDDD
jgi:hypothetical protein